MTESIDEAAALPLDSRRPCPYSEETVTGCRHYAPVSVHGGFPGAACCHWAVNLSTHDYIRTLMCRRPV